MCGGAAGGGEGGGAAAAHAACKGGSTGVCGRRAQAECTSKITSKFVTLDVSQPSSGWLNAFAPCRAERGGHTMRGGRRGAAAAHAACKGSEGSRH